MRIILNQPTKCEAFTQIIQNIRNFTENINIQFNAEGMFIQTMDNAHISVVELSLPAGWFNEYQCETDVVLGVNMSILSKILSTKDKSQTLILENNPENEDKLEIHFTSGPQVIENVVIDTTNPITIKVKKSTAAAPKPKLPDVKIYDTHFEIPLVDIDSEMISIPEIDYAAEFSLNANYFSNIVSQLKLFGDTMDIDCTEEKIVLYSLGTESGKMSVDINIDELTSFAINEGQTIRISFSLNYLHNICGFHKLTREIELKICENYPLCASYLLGDDAHIKFYLAPKMTDDE